MQTEEMLSWARFVAEKFSKNHEGWVYSRDTNGLRSIRYESDYTGYNHWKKRLKRAFNLKAILGMDSVSRQLGVYRKRDNLKSRFWGAYWHIVIALKKSDNLPDGQINGIITHWEEDGEYIAFFQPIVGMKVLDFLEDDPDNPHAIEIVSAMHRAADLSFNKEKDDDS